MFFLPQPWAWDRRTGSELPDEFLRFLSDPELNGPALGGQIHWSVMLQPVLTAAAGLFICFLTISELPDLSPLATLLIALLAAQLVYRLSRWWRRNTSLVTRALAVLTGILAFIFSFLVLTTGPEGFRFFDVVVIIVIYLIGDLAFNYYLWYRELVFITTKRVITVTGIINRNVAMMPLSKLTDMNYTRTPAGLLLGYGSFRFETAGQNQALELLGRIPDPDASYRYVQNLLFGRGTTDVVLVDVKTEKKVNVNWRGRLFPTGRSGGATLEPAEDDEWYDSR